MTWDRRLYFPSEGRRAEDFFRPKNPTASAGFEPANLGTKSQHARPPKPLFTYISAAMIYVLSVTEIGTGNLRVLRQQRLKHRLHSYV